MAQAARDRLTRGYAALAGLERRCFQTHFQEPRSKGWLFDTLMTPALMYAAAVWAPGITEAMWTRIERPQITMISRLLRSKPSVPHDIIRAELGTPPMLVEALFQAVSFVHSLWDTTRDRYTRLALESSRQLALQGDTSCWFAQMTSWFQTHGFTMDRRPPFKYSLQTPLMYLTRVEITRLIRQDLIQLDTRRTWIEPTQELGTKMALYREHLLHLTTDGFVTRPSYMDTHQSHALRCAIGQLRTSSHQLEIEIGRFRGVPSDSKICRLCHLEPETELHYICHCTVYYEIRGCFHCLFREGFGPLSRVMSFEDQRCLGLYLLEEHRHRDTLLRRAGGRQSQRQITDFFTPGTGKLEEQSFWPSEDVNSVKQGCPLSPTLFGLYIDEITEYIQRARGREGDLGGTPVHILLYADDIVPLSESQEGLQSHLQALDTFCMERGLTVNLGKTKVMIFHTSRTVRHRASFTKAGGQIEVVDSYVYLGVTFSGSTGVFSMAQAA
ncbi:hypothetical protein KP509_07G098200 [Ceratopteris richardii]|uniref:Reverse transcriptase domain-containing protein n=1 Tax=Ceratopteris richardii TaxID=49495 RepID=A0A8T2UCR0_CERRI|nr:hypothetical protein KP509_07G098200 [Ceratopteris richardii]